MSELPTPAAAPPPAANPYAAAFAALRAQAPALGATSAAARRQRLTRLEGWLLRNRAAVQQALHQDFRKPAAETDLTELWPALTELRHTRRHLRRWLARRRVGTPLPLLGTRSWVQLEAKGVVLIIAPWNYPFYLALDPLVSALAAGNAVVLKPAEQTPATSALLQRMAQELFPPEEVLVVEGGQPAATALLALPFDHIFFTGSPAVGKVVMRAAAEHLSGLTLELGGKSPAIVDETADLRDAAQKLVWGKFLNAGQTCVAPDYLLVHASVRDPLVQAMREVLTQYYNPAGLGAQQSPALARIVNARHFARLAGLLADAQARGATLACGGHLDPRDCFIEPTILLDVPAGATILDEEIFGPLLPVLTFTTLAEAAAYVNARPKPLAQYVFSTSPANQRFLLARIAAGGAALNETILQLAHPGLPFGGVGNSGLGKAHGYAGLLAFSNEKAVLQQRVGLTNLRAFYPPYTGRTQRLLGWLLRYL